MKEKISITVDSEILRSADRLVDNVLIRNRSQAIEYLLRKTLGSERTAVILCGGPEEMIRIGEEYRPTVKIGTLPVIEHAINKLRENNFKNIFVIARSPVLTKIFEILKDGKELGVKVTYVDEKKSKGTAESLRLLEGKVHEKFLTIYGDVIFDKINIEALWKEHGKNNFIATLMLTTSSNFSEKGTVYVEGNKITQFIQKPKKSDNYIVFSPIFVADIGLFKHTGDSLERDVFPRMAEKGLLGAYLSSEKERHIHSIEDVKKSSKTANKK